MNNTQPKYMEANYSASQLFDMDQILEELNLSWDNIELYEIKWGVLSLHTKDGKIHEWHDDPAGYSHLVDYKRPYDIHELDGNYKALKEAST